jgi:hypothetical protein
MMDHKETKKKQSTNVFVMLIKDIEERERKKRVYKRLVIRRRSARQIACFI